MLYCIFIGVPFDRGGLVLWGMLGLAAATIGRGRTGTVIVDFLPFGLVLVGYDFLRGLATKIGMPTHWHIQMDLDRDMFFGHLPTVWVQGLLKYPTVQWWEILVGLCYVSYFVLFIVTAAVLWLRSRRDFYRWSCRFIPLCLIAFTFFALTPAAPPWAAARCTSADVANDPANPPCMYQSPSLVHGGMIGPLAHPRPGAYPYVQRLSVRGLQYLHVTKADAVLRNGQHISDMVAAVPSMHSAGVMLFAIFMWRRVRPLWRILLAAYPLAMAFTLVFTGEHYVTDILLGWLAAAFVSVVAAWIERRLRNRSSAKATAGRLAKV